MRSTQGHYAAVQFCPDFSRQEFVNIGVALYSAELRRVFLKMSSDNRRLTQVFGRQDLHLVNRLKRSLEESLRREFFATVSELELQVSRSANKVRLGGLRPVKIHDLEADLKALYRRLVEEPQHAKRRVYKVLKEKLIEGGVEDFVQKSVDVEIPAVDQSIRVPYAYQNGRYNLISPVDFTSDVLARAGEKAIQGQLIYEHPDAEHGKMRLLVVANFGDEIPTSARDVVADILTKHNVAIHTFDNIAPLIENIRQSAIEHGLTEAI